MVNLKKKNRNKKIQVIRASRIQTTSINSGTKGVVSNFRPKEHRKHRNYHISPFICKKYKYTKYMV